MWTDRLSDFWEQNQSLWEWNRAITIIGLEFTEAKQWSYTSVWRNKTSGSRSPAHKWTPLESGIVSWTLDRIQSYWTVVALWNHRAVASQLFKSFEVDWLWSKKKGWDHKTIGVSSWMAWKI